MAYYSCRASRAKYGTLYVHKSAVAEAFCDWQAARR